MSSRSGTGFGFGGIWQPLAFLEGKEIGLVGQPKCPWTLQLAGAILGAPILKLLTSASLKLSFTRVWESSLGCSFGAWGEPALLLCSASPGLPGVLMVAPGAVLQGWRGLRGSQSHLTSGNGVSWDTGISASAVRLAPGSTNQFWLRQALPCPLNEG